jgi:hypothetical protein
MYKIGLTWSSGIHFKEERLVEWPEEDTAAKQLGQHIGHVMGSIRCERTTRHFRNDHFRETRVCHGVAISFSMKNKEWYHW